MARQRWLQRNQAIAVVNAYAEALKGGSDERRTGMPQHRGMRTPPQGKKVSGGALLNMMRSRFVN